MKNCTVIDNETGEILTEDFNIMSEEDKERQQKAIDYNRLKTEFEDNLMHNYGNFYFNFYNKLPHKLDKQYIFRFIYLCTYLKFDDNRLMQKAAKNRYELLKVGGLMELLQLSQREYYRTRKELEDKKLITINKDNSIKVNKKISFIGSVAKNNKQEYSRIFKNAIQDLYKNSKPREHKKLALFIELLPFIHYKYNIICSNPECDLMEDVKPLTLQQLSVISQTYAGKNITRFKNNLLNIMVNEQKAMMMVEDYNKKFFIVNPGIYYKGNKIEDLRYLIDLFRIK